MTESKEERVWTLTEAKVRLSELMRMAESEGPQRIGTQHRYVVVPERTWDEMTRPKKSLGKWLVENMPRGTNLEIPDRRLDKPRPIPFIDE